MTLELVAFGTDMTPVPDLLPLPVDADYAQSKRYLKFLMRKSAFGYARDILAHAARQLDDLASSDTILSWRAEQRLWISQQRALCTYKDPTLPNNTRLRSALAILQDDCGLNLKTCDNPETLGLGGAVHKRLWDINHIRTDLELALAYYRRGYDLMLEKGRQPDSEQDASYDAGAFTGVNVVYLSEVLAVEIPTEVDANAREAHLSQAHSVRQQLARDLPQLWTSRAERGDPDWWLAVTLLEVYFGLGCRDPDFRHKVMDQATRVASLDTQPWQQESTGSQLLRCAQLQKRLGSAPAAEIDRLLREVVDIAFEGTVNTRQARLDGKLGLALSGGGFRASLFHIGVLARMAELDLLRHVEVISCVSGGSIVGAHYYLLLRKLLQDKADGEIKRTDYVVIVDKLLDQFLAGIQKNIRMRVAASWIGNIRMIFQPSLYSRTQRLGRLYEKYLYGSVKDDEGYPAARWLNEAFIVPRREEADRKEKGSHIDGFSPKLDNWRRAAKVPMLVLNATTLNTGRNWQFTASFMGEPLSYGTGVDSTERLDAVYFSEAPEGWQRYRLGEAVAASSCVPALFTPIVLPNLFKGRTVRLVDGGVHDNQGTRALLDQDCDTLIVSDASGQMQSLPNPSHGELGVILRTNSVLQARIRIAQHQELESRTRTSSLRRCVYLHLRKDIESKLQEVAAHSTAVTSEVSREVPSTRTEYGIDREVQLALSNIRTDLDSFSDREALSLMYSGYKMAEKYLDDLAVAPTTREKWRFEQVAVVARGIDTVELTFKTLLRHLTTGSRLAFKVWRLHPVLSNIRIAFLTSCGVAALAALLYLICADISVPVPAVSLGRVATRILLAAATLGVGLLIPVAKSWISRAKLALNPGATVARVGLGIVMALVGCLICRLHVWFFDWIFLRIGRMRREGVLTGREQLVMARKEALMAQDQALKEGLDDTSR